jgi:hypothetical protein
MHESMLSPRGWMRGGGDLAFSKIYVPNPDTGAEICDQIQANDLSSEDIMCSL